MFFLVWQSALSHLPSETTPIRSNQKPQPSTTAPAVCLRLPSPLNPRPWDRNLACNVSLPWREGHPHGTKSLPFVCLLNLRLAPLLRCSLPAPAKQSQQSSEIPSSTIRLYALYVYVCLPTTSLTLRLLGLTNRNTSPFLRPHGQCWSGSYYSTRG